MTNQEIYDISDDAFHWFLGTCGKKWKEFKSTLKKQFFNEKITNAQLKAMHAGRVNDDDWKFLANYWRSPDCEVCWITNTMILVPLGLSITYPQGFKWRF